MSDYYKTLGLEKGASRDEVKKAFRKKAAQHHPDKKTGNEEKYKEVTEAYSVLGDEKKKAEYDTYGQSFNGGGGGGFGGFQGGQGFGGAGFEFDLNDLFQGFGGAGKQQAQRGRDASVDMQITFEESVFGVTKKIAITKDNACKECSGTGGKKGTAMDNCSTCAGQGKVRENRQSLMGTFTTVRECFDCNGSGKVPKEKCTNCRGAGVARSEEEISIQIPAGVQNGEVMRMNGRGEATSGGSAGDLYIKVHVSTHKTIKREGSTLYTTLAIKLTDALLGASYKVETLDGETTIKIPAGITHGELLRIKDKGVPLDRGRGDFMVKVLVATPKKLSNKAQKLVEELQGEGI
jgi:molecular chaperone DnaJ